MARNAAEDYLRDDPGLESVWGQRMLSHLRDLFDKQANWGLIS